MSTKNSWTKETETQRDRQLLSVYIGDLLICFLVWDFNAVVKESEREKEMEWGVDSLKIDLGAPAHGRRERRTRELETGEMSIRHF